jgi:hypothetical protein
MKKHVNGNEIRSMVNLDLISGLISKIYAEYQEKFSEVSLIPATNIYSLIYQKETTKEYTKLEQKSIQFLEKVDEFFFKEFWDNEMMQTMNSNLFAPISISYDNNKIDDITLDIDKGTKLYSIPIGLYDEREQKYIYLNKNLKNRILAEYNYTQFYSEDGFENVTLTQANQISVLLRLAFYESGLGINKSNDTNNLLKFKLEFEDGTYLSLYVLVDYGIPDPEKSPAMIQKLNMLKILGKYLNLETIKNTNKENII